MLKKKPNFYVKIHNEVTAICDSDLIGKILEEKDLELKVTENFYKGELVNEEQLISIIKEARNLNVVGKNIVDLCLKLKLIEKEHVLFINKIPHAQMFEI